MTPEERIKELEQSNENLVEQSMILLKRQTELEMQIQKMMNCYNCKFVGEDLYGRKICKLGQEKCHNYNQWQLK